MIYFLAFFLVNFQSLFLSREGAGLLEPLGHLDFYANGGMRQPGCEPSNWDSILSDPLAIPSDVIVCDHTRAVHIYSESLLSSSCKTIGYECSDYDSFNKVTVTTCFKFTVINVINLII